MDLIEFNLIIPSEDASVLLSKNTGNFVVISSVAFGTAKKTLYFHIRAPEEEMTYLILKYGRANVWKR